VAAVESEFRLAAALQALSDQVLAAVEADQSSVMLLDATQQMLRCTAASGLDVGRVRGANVKIGEGIAGVAAQNRESLILSP
jgi:signal transduction protein with GAF and PtsI domain